MNLKDTRTILYCKANVARSNIAVEASVMSDFITSQPLHIFISIQKA